MPVITRNQIKKMTAAKPVLQPVIVVTRVEQTPLTISSFWHSDDEAEFVRDIKRLLADCELASGKTAKMQVSLQIYNRVNDKLENLLQDNSPKWLKFAATVYNKTSEFEVQFYEKIYNEVDVKLVETFRKTYQKARQFLSKYFKNLRATRPGLINLTESPYVELFKNIDEEDFKAAQCSRPRRNIPVVDYTGMDTIEPESEYDGITDIWHDNSIWYDSDYNPEDDEDDEDDEDNEEQDEELFKKKMQHVTVRKQTNLLPLLLFTRYDDEEVMRKNMPNVTVRPKRRTPRVDYSGMDMTDEDEGTVYICETKWKHRVPTHRWVEYPASQANELGDEDWCEEY